MISFFLHCHQAATFLAFLLQTASPYLREGILQDFNAYWYRYKNYTKLEALKEKVVAFILTSAVSSLSVVVAIHIPRERSSFSCQASKSKRQVIVDTNTNLDPPRGAWHIYVLFEVNVTFCLCWHC